MIERNAATPSRSAVLAVLALVLVAAVVQGATAEEGPVLLVYGFQPLIGFHAPQLWSDLAIRISGRPVSEAETVWLDAWHRLFRLPALDEEHRDVFISDYGMPYEPTVRDLRFYAFRLSEELAWIEENAHAGALDVIAFSMGALVVRCVIESGDFETALGTSEIRDYGAVDGSAVRTLISIAGPHHGAEFAAIGPWFGPLPQQLDPSSSFLATLNDASDGEGSGLAPGVRYVSLAGQSCLGFGCSIRSDVETCRRECVVEGLAWEGHDLVIVMGSARLDGAENVPCIGFDHIDMRTAPVILDVLARLLRGEMIEEAIYATEELAQAANDP